MRIIGGAHRGLTLATVGKGDAAAHLRPTTDRVRESLFNLLQNYDGALADARVLDLFAGTGALGLEALSRGAAHVTFVENGTKSTSLIRENIRKMRAEDQTILHRRDATKLGDPPGAPFGLVFLDPPYGTDLGGRALEAADRSGWIAKDALIVWEDNAPPPPPAGYSLEDSRRYGDTHITILRRTG